MLTAIAKRARLLCRYPLFLINPLEEAVLRSLDDFISLRVGNARLIGTREHVEQCAEVLEEFRVESQILYAALVKSDPFVFCCLPAELHKSRVSAPHFLINQAYWAWGKAGLRAFLVRVAFLVRANLHHPSVYLDDFYGDHSLTALIFNQTTAWLKSHDQPEALVQYFASQADWYLRRQRQRSSARV